MRRALLQDGEEEEKDSLSTALTTQVDVKECKI